MVRVLGSIRLQLQMIRRLPRDRMVTRDSKSSLRVAEIFCARAKGRYASRCCLSFNTGTYAVCGL